MRSPSRGAADEAAMVKVAAGSLSLWVEIGVFKPGATVTDPEVELQGDALRWLHMIPNDTAYPVPEEILEFVRKAVIEYKSRSRGRGRYTGSEFSARNRVVVDAVKLVCARSGFNPLKNRERTKRRTPSACSVVQKALASLGVAIPERTVEEIWRKRNALPDRLRVVYTRQSRTD
jgi:hypothetical protein